MSEQYVVFDLEAKRFALRVSTVERVVRMVRLTPWPDAPRGVLGYINLQGRIIPVISLRSLLGAEERPVEVDDRLIVLTTGERTMALVVDKIIEVCTPPDGDLLPASEFEMQNELLEGIIKRDHEMILVQKIETLGKIGEEMLESLAPLEPILEAASGEKDEPV